MCPKQFNLEPYRVKNIVHTFGQLDVKKAWELPGEEVQLPISDVEHVLRESSWDEQTPLEAGAHEPHWSLMLESDLSYPIIVTQEETDSLTIVDGRHRILKAWLLGEKFITAKMLDVDLLRDKATIPFNEYDRLVEV